MHAAKAQQASLSRIRKRADFLKTQGQGRRWVASGLILQTAPNRQGVRRVGYTVSKRVDKSAVRRNRIKRRLRAASAARSYKRLCADLRWCLRRMELAAGETAAAP